MYMEMDNFSKNYIGLNLMDVKVGKMPNKTQNRLAISKNFKVTGILKTYIDGQTEFMKRS